MFPSLLELAVLRICDEVHTYVTLYVCKYTVYYLCNISNVLLALPLYSIRVHDQCTKELLEVHGQSCTCINSHTSLVKVLLYQKQAENLADVSTRMHWSSSEQEDQWSVVKRWQGFQPISSWYRRILYHS